MKQDYNLWFGNRLKEVMDHFGMSAKSLGEQSGVGRMTIARIMRGRYATAMEVDQIAVAMGITTERLKQKDVDLAPEKWNRNNAQFDPSALQEARRIVSVALGKTETGFAYRALGAMYYTSDLGKSVWAYQKSCDMLKDSEDSNEVYLAYLSLMEALLMRGDYERLQSLFQEAEDALRDHPELFFLILQFKAGIMVNHTKQYEEALSLCEQLGRMVIDQPMRYRRTLCNMGDISFRMRKYEQAKLYYEKAFHRNQIADTNRLSELYMAKDYVKTLTVAGESDQARQVLGDHMDEALAIGDLKLQSIYLALHEVLHQDGSAARQLLKLDEVSEPLQIMAAMLLCFAHRENGEHDEMRQVFGKMLSDCSVLE